MNGITALQAQLNRRELLRLGAMAGLGAAFFPRLAWAAQQPNLSPQVSAL
ncbi:MAG: twin-arginine translocation signal domain-containing protein, partial [Sphingomonadales bacterium]|nr:twin-arginine translocation signal domain-containing protein [Sphingomonadales bacterium]